MFSNETIKWLEENDYTPNDINKVGKHGNSALMKACREAKADIVKEILECKPDLEISNVDGNTALWNACFGQDYRCVEQLVNAGIYLDKMNDNGVTALMYSASAGKEDMVKLLLDFGANKELSNLDDFKAIDLACTPRIYKLLK
ncbi:MAG: ankyrin repeat domain-containing protein [Arcobacteraceae bacterium]|jgi:ankyrin repeat protein|nr:ankyrin repeat domain-containing protein [Arcobacteraceae bacterium]